MNNHFFVGFEKCAFIGSVLKTVAKAPKSVIGKTGKWAVKNPGKALGVGMTGAFTVPQIFSDVGNSVSKINESRVMSGFKPPLSTF